MYGNVHMHPDTYMYPNNVHTQAHANKYALNNMHTQMHIHMHMYPCIHTMRMPIYAHTCAHTNTYTQMCR